MDEMTVEAAICPIRYALNVVGGKWKLPILCLLSGGGPTRYGVIKRKLSGITNMMLSQSLKELEAQGMVDRKQYNEIPPRVEYTLTADGMELLPALERMAKWGAEQMERQNAGTAGCIGCQAESKDPSGPNAAKDTMAI